jgi:hypothetical protein
MILSMPRASASLFALVKAAKGEFKRVDKSDDGRHLGCGWIAGY